MKITRNQLISISKNKSPNAANIDSIVTAVNEYGERFGLDQPHRLAHFIAQLAHESGGFKYDKEIASGKAYEGRKDLGNTKKGDGVKYKGRAGIQITGRANYTAFTKWAEPLGAPNFVAEPEKVNTDPWEGLAPIWYWDHGNPDPKGRSLNAYADTNNLEMITRRINGGLHGFEDRIDYYDRTALVFLGYPVNAVRKFQEDAHRRGDYKEEPDGQPGPKTRAALHMALMRMSGAQKDKDTAVAPVTEEKEVVPPKVEKEVKEKSNWLMYLIGLFATGGPIATWVNNSEPYTIAVAAGAGLVLLIVAVLIRRQLIETIKGIREALE